QHFDEAAVAQLVCDVKTWQLDETAASQGTGHIIPGVVDRHPSTERVLAHPTVDDQVESVVDIVSYREEADRLMVRQLVRMSRRAETREVLRTGANYLRHHCQSPRHQTRIARRSGTNHAVHTFANQIDQPVAT